MAVVNEVSTVFSLEKSMINFLREAAKRYKIILPKNVATKLEGGGGAG